MEISFSQIEKIFKILMQNLKRYNGSEIQLNETYYLKVSDRENILKEPSICLESLEYDLHQIKNVLNLSETASPEDFVNLGNLLKEISDHVTLMPLAEEEDDEDEGN